MGKFSRLVLPTFVLVLVTSLVMALFYSNQLTINLLVGTQAPLSQSATDSDNECDRGFVNQILEEDVHLPFTVTVPFFTSGIELSSFPQHVPFLLQVPHLDIIKPPSRLS